MELLTALVGIGVTIMVAAVPWAFAVHGRLSSIETKLIGNEELQKDLRRVETRLVKMETRQSPTVM